jgi:hypothetical protein
VQPAQPAQLDLKVQRVKPERRVRLDLKDLLAQLALRDQLVRLV